MESAVIPSTTLTLPTMGRPVGNELHQQQAHISLDGQLAPGEQEVDVRGSQLSQQDRNELANDIASRLVDNAELVRRQQSAILKDVPSWGPPIDNGPSATIPPAANSNNNSTLPRTTSTQVIIPQWSPTTHPQVVEITDHQVHDIANPAEVEVVRGERPANEECIELEPASPVNIATNSIISTPMVDASSPTGAVDASVASLWDNLPLHDSVEADWS